jgi:hypothetical protein
MAAAGVGLLLGHMRYLCKIYELGDRLLILRSSPAHPARRLPPCHQLCHAALWLAAGMEFSCGVVRMCVQVQEIQEVGQSRVVLEAITVAHRRTGQNLFRLCVDISNLDSCYLLGNWKNNWHNY